MLKQNKTLGVVALIALVNMLGYGVIIPILYSYSKRFGLSDFQNGLLFAIYSICQFISTPIIGRLSDKYGRKPLLLISIIGTAISFFVMGFARSATALFVARAVDGLTAGNVPVIFAVISDSVKPQDRPKAFGMIGSAFNFGFIFGPAISALTVGYGVATPFFIAGAITVIAIIMTILYLKETNVHMGEVEKAKLFDFPKMWHTLFDPNVGVTFIISLIYFLAFSCAIIFGFQPFTMNVLKITAAQNAELFTVFGIFGLIAQNLLVAPVTKRLGMKHAFTISMLVTALSFLIMFGLQTLPVFAVAIVLLSVANSVAQTMIPSILSQETDEKSQGSIMGLNSSYQSIGMIVGPLLGGVVASYSSTFPFLMGAILVMGCVLLSSGVMRPGVRKESAF